MNIFVLPLMRENSTSKKGKKFYIESELGIIAVFYNLKLSSSLLCTEFGFFSAFRVIETKKGKINF